MPNSSSGEDKSEFERLDLQEVWPSLTPPFLHSHSLERFLQRLARHPKLSRTEIFQNFLESTEWVRSIQPNCARGHNADGETSHRRTSTSTSTMLAPLRSTTATQAFSTPSQIRFLTPSPSSRSPTSVLSSSDSTSTHSRKAWCRSSDSPDGRKHACRI